MNLNAELSKDSFSNFYEDNKDYAVPIVAIIISALLLLFIIVPQISAIPQKKGEFDNESQKVEDLRQYHLLLQNADTLEVDDNVQMVSRVLPPEKDFESILNSILSVGNSTGTFILGYDFQSEVSAGAKDTRKFPEIRFSIDIDGGPIQAVRYINELYDTAPISEISQITTKNGVTTIVIVFYYKPFTPVGFEQRTSFQPLNVEEQAVFNEVSRWSVPLESEILIQDSSSSATLSE